MLAYNFQPLITFFRYQHYLALFCIGTFARLFNLSLDKIKLSSKHEARRDCGEEDHTNIYRLVFKPVLRTFERELETNSNFSLDFAN